ncbi:oxidoreductase yurR [Nocardioides sp. CF8]|nr:oxidoreductase yurR [Nocardioides sp. CF8]
MLRERDGTILGLLVPWLGGRRRLSLGRLTRGRARLRHLRHGRVVGTAAEEQRERDGGERDAAYEHIGHVSLLPRVGPARAGRPTR